MTDAEKLAKAWWEGHPLSRQTQWPPEFTLAALYIEAANHVIMSGIVSVNPTLDPVEAFVADCWAGQANGTQGQMHEWIKEQVAIGRIIIPGAERPQTDVVDPRDAVVEAALAWAEEWDRLSGAVPDHLTGRYRAIYDAAQAYKEANYG